MSNLNSIDNKQHKRLQKKDLLFICGFSSMLLLFNIFLNNIQLIPSIIAYSSIAFILIFYFAKTTKKALTETDIMFNIGFVGLFGSFTSNLLIAIHNGTNLLVIVVIFFVLAILSFIISSLLVLFNNLLKRKNKNRININIMPFASIGAIFGVMISKHLRSINIEISLDILIYLLNLLLSFIAIINLIKAKKFSTFHR